jgi:hypothetical protein
VLIIEVSTIDYDYIADGPLGPPVPDDLLDQVIRAVRRALGEVLR